jgi:hypothetical protein
MKRVLLIISLFFLTACSKSDSVNNCNFLANIGVNAIVNLNLPQFSQLQFISNSVYIPNQGNGGIIVTNVGAGVTPLRAWDASDPNHIPESCSILQIESSNGVCGCVDANTYSLFTGQSIGDPLPCTLKEYRVSPSGNNTFIISN